MPRGGPDYGNPGYQIAVPQLDTGDLLVGMRGLNSCDGRGRLFFLDTFGEGASGWAPMVTAGVPNPFGYMYQAEVPPVCLKMDVSAVPGTSTGGLKRDWNSSNTNRIGLEVGVNWGTFRASLKISLRTRAAVGYTYGTLTLQNDGQVLIRDAAFTNRLITTVPTPASGNAWMPLKIVTDSERKIWVRIVIGQDEYDVSKYGLWPDATAWNDDIYAELLAISVAGGYNTVYLGHVILTLDEP
jgi:hypothetical protein